MPVKLSSTGGGSVTLTTPSTASDFTLTAPAQTATLITNSSDVLDIGSGQIYKDASGNVGIGTSSPDALLTVNTVASFGAGAAALPSIAAKGDLNTGMWFPAADTIAASTGGSERARITSGGNLLVGTSSTFDVTSGATTQLSGQCAVYNGGSPNTLMSFYNSTQAARVGFIGSNGNSTSYNSGSDYRLKENVTNISAAAAAVQSLRPVTFTWKVSPETGTFSGFIAHELQGVWPEAVVGEKDAICSDGVTPDYQMVDQSKLVPLLTAALQEALTEISSLKARLTALEAN